MESDIFGFLSKKFIKQRIIDSLLHFLTKAIISVSLFPFIFNLILPNIKVLISAIIILLFYELSEAMKFYFNRAKQIKIINLLNPQMRNLILASFEVSEKKNKEIPENEILSEFEKININEINYFSPLERTGNIRIFFLSLVIFLLLLVIYPLYFSNMLSLTEKAAIIEYKENEIKIIGYNLGTISGRLYTEYRGKRKKFHYGKEYDDRAKISYQGPAVKSNCILYKNIKEIKIDSLNVKIIPSAYQKRKEYNEKTFTVFAPEYSSVFAIIYKNGTNDTIFKNEMLAKNETIDLRSNYSKKLIINIVKDAYPAVKMLLSENDLKNKENVIIPCAYIDDYEIEKLGVIIKTEMDSLNFTFDKISDSLTWLKFDLSAIKENEGYIMAYAKDNNPYRNQISFSQKIIFNKNIDILEMLSEMDSNNVFSNFAENAEEMMNEINERKMELAKENIEKTMKKYKENLQQIKNAIEEMKQNVEEISQNQLPDEIMKQMYEIKREIEKIDEEILAKIMEKLSKMDESAMKKETAMNMLKKDAKEIESALKQLEKMLEQLNKLSELKEFQENLEQISQIEDLVMSEKEGKEQKDVTERIESEIEKSKDSSNLQEWADDMSSLKSMSKNAEKEKKKAEDVKKKLDEIKKDVQSKMNEMTKESQYDKNQAIISLLLLNEMMVDKKQAINFYADFLEFTKAKDDPKNPLFLHIIRGINIAEDKASSLRDLINHNYLIISFLLKKNPSSGSGMSLEEMMENLSSLSEEQRALSQTLWNMFSEQNMSGEMMKELARYQSEIARKIKELSKKGEEGAGLDEIGDSLSDVAEEIAKQNISEELLKKQERTLNKMLKMTKSLYKQGITEKRESKTGKDYSDPVKRIVPEDFGYKKRNIEKMMLEFIRDYKDEEREFYIKKYYMEILK